MCMHRRVIAQLSLTTNDFFMTAKYSVMNNLQDQENLNFAQIDTVMSAEMDQTYLNLSNEKQDFLWDALKIKQRGAGLFDMFTRRKKKKEDTKKVKEAEETSDVALDKQAAGLATSVDESKVIDLGKAYVPMVRVQIPETKDGEPDLGRWSKSYRDIVDDDGTAAKMINDETLEDGRNMGSAVLGLTTTSLGIHMKTMEQIGTLSKIRFSKSSMKIPAIDAEYQDSLQKLIDQEEHKSNLLSLKYIAPSESKKCDLIIKLDQVKVLNEAFSREFLYREHLILNQLAHLKQELRESLEGPYRSIKEIASQVLGETNIGEASAHVTNRHGLSTARNYIKAQLDIIEQHLKDTTYNSKRLQVAKMYKKLTEARYPASAGLEQDMKTIEAANHQGATMEVDDQAMSEIDENAIVVADGVASHGHVSSVS